MLNIECHKLPRSTTRQIQYTRDALKGSCRLNAGSSLGTHTSFTQCTVSMLRASPLRQSVQTCAGGHTVYEGEVHATNTTTKYAIVVSRFNSLITKGLLEGALHDFERHGVPAENIDVAWVPGCFELPVVAKNMAASNAYAAVVCIGAVIRGATSHYDAVVNAATSGVLSASVGTGVPVIFGVLTTDTLEQALDRCGGKVGNKGGEAAVTAIEMANLMAKLSKFGKAKAGL